MAGVLNAIRERKEVHAKAQDARELSWTFMYHAIACLRSYQNYHISESIRKTAKRGHCTRAEQECNTMTD